MAKGAINGSRNWRGKDLAGHPGRAICAGEPRDTWCLLAAPQESCPAVRNGRCGSFRMTCC